MADETDVKKPKRRTTTRPRRSRAAATTAEFVESDDKDRTEAELASHDEIVSRNPATMEEVGRVRVTPPSELDAIVARAAEAQRRWAQVPLRERGRLIERAADHFLDNHEKVAALLTNENGKTIVESYAMELVPVLDTFHFVAKHGADILKDERIPTPQLHFKTKKHFFRYAPIGVVGIIAPWNYPLSIPAGEAAIALMAGNAVIMKPSPLTPIIAGAIERAFEAAGLPDDLFQVVHGDAPIGQAMCSHPGIGTIFFTGSVPTGRAVAQACAAHLKPFVLELGGKDAAIVLADADLDRAARGVLYGGVGNAGQTCAGIERVYVNARVYDAFLDRLVAGAESLRAGDPQDPTTQVGPFTDVRQYEKVVSQVDEAIEHGAKRHTGGPVDVGLPGKWYAPAIITGVDHSMRLMREETFGPVVPIMKVEDDREAVRLANDSEYGLGASVWSRDTAHARALATQIDAGMVWINDHMYSHTAAELPWGGVKHSGVGITHSKFGFYACTRPRLLSVDSGRMSAPWWHPYDEKLRDGLQTVARTMYGGSAADKLRTALAGRSEFKGLLDRARKPTLTGR